MDMFSVDTYKIVKVVVYAVKVGSLGSGKRTAVYELGSVDLNVHADIHINQKTINRFTRQLFYSIFRIMRTNHRIMHLSETILGYKNENNNKFINQSDALAVTQRTTETSYPLIARLD